MGVMLGLCESRKIRATYFFEEVKEGEVMGIVVRRALMYAWRPSHSCTG